jgi:hypothetical protein
MKKVKVKKNRGDQLNHRPFQKVDYFVEKLKNNMMKEDVELDQLNSKDVNTKDEFIKKKLARNYEILKALEAEMLKEEETRQQINTQLEEQDYHSVKEKLDKIKEIDLKKTEPTDEI